MPQRIVLSIGEQIYRTIREKIIDNEYRPGEMLSIDKLAEAFGVQCVVVGVDSAFQDGEWRVHQYTGDPDARRGAGRQSLAGARRTRPVELAEPADRRGDRRGDVKRSASNPNRAGGDPRPAGG